MYKPLSQPMPPPQMIGGFSKLFEPRFARDITPGLNKPQITDEGNEEFQEDLGQMIGEQKKPQPTKVIEQEQEYIPATDSPPITHITPMPTDEEMLERAKPYTSLGESSGPFGYVGGGEGKVDGHSIMPITGTTSGDESLPLYRFVSGEKLNSGSEHGIHWTHSLKEMEQMASEEPGFIIKAKHPGKSNVMDWDNPKDLPVMEREIGGKEYKDKVFPEVPIRPGTKMSILDITQVGYDGKRTKLHTSPTQGGGVGRVVGFRYGGAPESGFSYNSATGQYEKGVSFASVSGSRQKQAYPNTRGIKYYEGDYVGLGSDEEPLLTNLREISKAEHDRRVGSTQALKDRITLLREDIESSYRVMGKGFKLSEEVLSDKEAELAKLVKQLDKGMKPQASSRFGAAEDVQGGGLKSLSPNEFEDTPQSAPPAIKGVKRKAV